MFLQIKKRLQPLVDSGVSTDEAVVKVRQMVIEDALLTQEVIEEAIGIASRYTFRSAIHKARRRICGESREEKSRDLKEKASSLMDFRLPYGGLLKEVTGKDCIENAKFYHKIAATNKRRGDFLEAVGKAAGKRIVGQALTEERINKIYKTTEVQQ